MRVNTVLADPTKDYFLALLEIDYPSPLEVEV
jgi:hypothetical protein